MRVQERGDAICGRSLPRLAKPIFLHAPYSHARGRAFREHFPPSAAHEA